MKINLDTLEILKLVAGPLPLEKRDWNYARLISVRISLEEYCIGTANIPSAITIQRILHLVKNPSSYGRELSVWKIDRENGQFVIYTLTNWLCCDRCGPTLGDDCRIIRKAMRHPELLTTFVSSDINHLSSAAVDALRSGQYYSARGFCHEGEHT